MPIQPSSPYPILRMPQKVEHNRAGFEFISAAKEVERGRLYKVAVKVVDIFGNDTMKVMEVET